MKTILYTLLTIAWYFPWPANRKQPVANHEPGDITTLTINEAAPDGSGKLP